MSSRWRKLFFVSHWEVFKIKKRWPKCQESGIITKNQVVQNSKKVSRVKFQLQRMGNNVVMEGKLMNGTYVNGLKLGKGKQHSLDQGDTISMLQMDFEVAPSHSETAMQRLWSRRSWQDSTRRCLEWGGEAISENAKDLITPLLVVDPSGKGGSVQNEAGESGGKGGEMNRGGEMDQCLQRRNVWINKTSPKYLLSRGEKSVHWIFRYP